MRIRKMTVSGLRLILFTGLVGILCTAAGVIDGAADERLLVKKVPYVYQRERLD